MVVAASGSLEASAHAKPATPAALVPCPRGAALTKLLARLWVRKVEHARCVPAHAPGPAWAVYGLVHEATGEPTPELLGRMAVVQAPDGAVAAEGADFHTTIWIMLPEVSAELSVADLDGDGTDEVLIDARFISPLVNTEARELEIYRARGGKLESIGHKNLDYDNTKHGTEKTPTICRAGYSIEPPAQDGTRTIVYQGKVVKGTHEATLLCVNGTQTYRWERGELRWLEDPFPDP